MSRNNIKLPQFLKEVDVCTEMMSHNNLERLIHEIARTWPESKREELLSLLKLYGSNSEKNIDTEVPTDDGYAETIAEIKEVRKKLEDINSGERELDSEYNEEWDDWYNSDADEIFFSDPQKLMDDIEAAVRLIHSCIDMEIYNEGCDLAETLSFLEVSASGDYKDYDGSPLGIQELYEHNLLEGNFEVLVKECLYLVYMGNKLSDRADEMFCMMENFGCYYIRLEDILQTGNRELPEFNEFLTFWIECLGKQRGRRTEELLKEAQSMVQDDFTLLENARKYVKEHPSLYKQVLEMKLNSGEDQKMLQIGMEALDSIPDSYLIRGEIALLTATYAEKMCDFEKAENCWLEAFRSNCSIINYMRLRFMTRHWQQYKAEVNSISEALFIKPKKEKNPYAYTMEQERENTISKEDYCTFLFFEQQFDKMEEIGMNTNKSLGWSETYMKQGISFMLLLLFRGDVLPSGLQAMLNRAISVCGFTAEEYYKGTDEYSNERDDELFLKLFGIWKEQVQLSDEDTQKWLQRIDKWIAQRTRGIMDNNRRNYYGECAAFIAALGEVLESFGEKGAKAGNMEKYKSEYSRRRAFHDELRKYGMKK